jgi:hypothetical protein
VIATKFGWRIEDGKSVGWTADPNRSPASQSSSAADAGGG